MAEPEEERGPTVYYVSAIKIGRRERRGRSVILLTGPRKRALEHLRLPIKERTKRTKIYNYLFALTQEFRVAEKDCLLGEGEISLVSLLGASKGGKMETGGMNRPSIQSAVSLRYKSLASEIGE